MELLRVPVVEAKLRPAALPKVVLYRQRYRSLAESLTSGRLTRVIAPGGYGKTTFLASFAGNEDLKTAAAEGRDLPVVAWYTLDDMDGDVVIFLTHLIRSVARVVPGFGSETQKTLSGVPDVDKQSKIVAAAMSEELWQTFSAISRDLVIVLDDYHSVSGSQAVNEVVQFLLTNAPGNVHLCIASRNEIPLRVQRLALQGQVQTIGSSDLCFELDEIRVLLDRISGKSWNAEAVSQVAASTEGWAAGVVLIGQSSNQGWEARARDPWGHDREATFRYFAEEIFSRQDERVRAFLTGAAFLRHLTAQAASEILGFEDAGALLLKSMENGLFLTRTESGNQDVYRFHQVFRAFLQRGLGKNEALALHRKAATFYEREAMLDAAMAHYLDGGLIAEAAALLERTGLGLIDAGRVDQLRHWLTALPQDMVEASPRLLYYTGFAYQNSDQARAVECLDKAARGLAEQGELGLQVRALIYMATIYSLQNQVEKVKEASSRIPVVTAMRKDSWARGVLTVSALCQAAWDDSLKRGVWLGRIARRLPLDPDWQWAMLAYSCMIYYRLGDLDIARKVIEEGLSLPVVKYNDNWQGLGLILYHVVLYLQDEDKTAEKVREELWNLGEKYDSPYYKAYAERARAHSHHQRGRMEQGMELLRSSLYFFEKAGNPAMANMTRLDLALLDTNFGNAQTALSDAREALANLSSLSPGQGLEETGESLFGAVAREAGDLKLAERHLLHSANVSRRKGAKQVLMGTCLHLAELYVVKGQDSLADRYLSEALGLASHHRYRVFWDFHRPTLLRQCVRALDRNIHPAYAEYLLSYWLGSLAADAVTSLAERVKDSRRGGLLAVASRLRKQTIPGSEAGDDAARQPDASGAASAVDSMPPTPPPVQVKMFGSFEVIIGGRPVPERAWQTRKVKALLKYIILNRTRRAGREEIMDLLWPDADPGAAAASLRVTLSRLRRALISGEGKTVARVSFLGEERGFVWFAPDGDCLLDVEEFEARVRDATRYLDDGDRARARDSLEQAVSLYRGDLLEEDPYEDWPVAERERLRMLYLNALLSLSRICLESGSPDYAQAIDLLLKALSVNPYREEVYLALMETYSRQGQAGEALRIYERCRKMLQEEFGVKPSQSMMKLVEDIRRRITVE